MHVKEWFVVVCQRRAARSKTTFNLKFNLNLQMDLRNQIVFAVLGHSSTPVIQITEIKNRFYVAGSELSMQSTVYSIKCLI